MKKMLCIMLAVFMGILFSFDSAMALGDPAPAPPGQAETGYGSDSAYICSGGTEYRSGNSLDPWAGMWCWYYVPDQLKYGSEAPAVVYLHGMTLQSPDIYKGHIDHLVKQGYIVFFPQINKGGIIGMLSDTDQNAMLRRSVNSTNEAIAKLKSELGDIIDENHIYMFGHSLGGMIAACWESAATWDGLQPVAIKGKCLANPSIDMSSVPDFVNPVPLDIGRAYLSTAPAILLAGGSDSIAPTDSSVFPLYQYGLINTQLKTLYEAYTDEHGEPALEADHMASIQDDGWMPGFIMDILGGDGEEDAMDYRYYWAAMDAVLDDQAALPFDMGAWSDDEPVVAPQQLAP